MNINDIKKLCNDKDIEVTSHILSRCYQRNISYTDIKHAIFNGTIIEQYENDYPYPSCLVLGKTTTNKILHVVVGIGNNKLWLITAYEPSLDKWNKDMKTRRSE